MTEDIITMVSDFVEMDDIRELDLNKELKSVLNEIKDYAPMRKWVFKFGKYKDQLISKVIETDLPYSIWFYGICNHDKLKEFVKLYIILVYYTRIRDLY